MTTAYMQVRELNDENEVELEFFADVYVTFKSKFLARRNGYPPLDVLRRELAALTGKVNLTLPDLRAMDCFQGNDHTSLQFLKHYCTMECLEPKPVREALPHEAVRDSNLAFVEWVLSDPLCIDSHGGGGLAAQIVEEMEKRTAWLLGRKPPTNRDHILLHQRWHKTEHVDTELIPTVLALQQQVRAAHH